MSGIPSGSEDKLRSDSALTRRGEQQIIQMTPQDLEKMVTDIFHCTLGPDMDDSKLTKLKEKTGLAVKNFFLKVQRNSDNGVSSPEPRRLALKFRNNLSLPICTGEAIKGEGYDSIEVALVDDLSGQVVKSGPGAKAEVEIVVLKGNMGESGNWTSEEFNSNIVKAREGEKSLLVGNVFLKLNKGIGVVGKMKFRHSSDWKRKGEFKLGARVKDSLAGTRIREAMTESFTVRDNRLKYTMKHDEPALTDEVWRLRNISKGKKIHVNLQERKIDTVRDFLVLLFKDPERLKCIVGSKNWEATVRNARKCKIEKRMECYIDSQRNSAVVFNLVDQVLGVVSECQYSQIEKLSDKHKEDAREMALYAIENKIEPVSFSDEASLLQYFSGLSASVNPRIPGGLEHHRDQNIAGSGTAIACSTSSLDFAAGASTHSASLNISDFEIVNCLFSEEVGSSPAFDQATLLQEFEEWQREMYVNDNNNSQLENLKVEADSNRQIAATSAMQEEYHPWKSWVVLINIVSLRWVSKRKKKATLQKLPVRKRQRI